MRFPFSLALASAGKSIAARIAIIAMTTSNSIRVKPTFNTGPQPGTVRSEVSELFFLIPKESSPLS